jgi:hypothetical protein
VITKKGSVVELRVEVLQNTYSLMDKRRTLSLISVKKYINSSLNKGLKPTLLKPIY